MKKAFLLFVMTLLLLASWAQAGVSKNISAPEAYQLLQNDARVFLLDVRTPKEYFDLRLTGAHLIPIDQFVKRIAEIPKDRPLLIYCAVGSRSSQVANYLAKQGYADVYNMYGGIYAWQLRKYPVLKGAP